VVVVAGKGNNGADGRAAAQVLAGRGVAVTVIPASGAGGDAGVRLPAADLVIDAAYGTGFRGSYVPPDPGGAPVLAVDIPSGLAGDTGVVAGGALTAVATVTFQAYKPGLLLGEGPERAGLVEVADIGLGPGVAERCTTWLVTDDDVALRVPPRPRQAHKWQSAVLAVAGSPGMMGAPTLVSRAAMRAGAGYVRLGVPGAAPGSMLPSEAVGLPLPAEGWAGVRLETPSADTVAIVVEDNGAGPPPQQREHLFDPFYSGRSAGRGRGLGLPTAWRLARQHGGDVRFVSLPDGPTRFVLSLPVEPPDLPGGVTG